jgi:hypothetical protein
VVLVAIALVLIPTLLRATHYAVEHQTVRLSILLNWNGEKPQTESNIPAPDTVERRALATVVDRHDETRDLSYADPADDSLRVLALDNAPDTPRGPPSPLFS